MKSHHSTRNRVIAAFAATVLMAGLAACGDTNSDAQASGELSGTLNIWGYANGPEEVIAAFEKANPKVTVKYSKQTDARDAAIQLSNAIAAGKGAPDVILLEDATVSQFAVQGDLVNLNDFGAQDYADDYSSGPWNKLQMDGNAYGLPVDGAPEVLYYNKTIFDKAGITTPPTTWDEYYEDAKKIRALGDEYYITNNAGFQPFTAQAWQAGGHPWKVDGENITINMTKDEGMQRYIEFTQKLLDENLINARINSWSEDWYRSLDDGTIASLTIGAWMGTNLKTSAPNQSGNWRVAALPKWGDGGEPGAEDGGSAFCITSQSKNQKLAWEFVKYATHEDGADVMVEEAGLFPSLKRILSSSDFVSTTDPYFGDQKINEVLVEAANQKVSQFQYLPYTAYAMSIYNDIIGPAYTGETTLKAAMDEYGHKLADYGKEQGYTVTVK